MEALEEQKWEEKVDFWRVRSERDHHIGGPRPELDKPKKREEAELDIRQRARARRVRGRLRFGSWDRGQKGDR